jgi:hypothetical protein
MNTLHIEATKSTPEIDFDPARHLLRITGQSYPENSFKFYEPVIAWMEEYFGLTGMETVIELNLPYINTSSSRSIMMIIALLEKMYQGGQKVELRWYYDPENDSELECAEEFKEDTTFPFAILPDNGVG